MKKIFVLCMIASFAATGCAVNIYKKSPKDKVEIQKLETKVGSLQRLRKEEQVQFVEAKRELQKQLKGQIGKQQVALDIEERGLVITLADSILFDSGQADIKSEAHVTLDKVIEVTQEKLSGKNIGIEGHTDNTPITKSGWKSNWELSTARATSVLHYLIKVGGIAPERLSATGYGEYKPIAANTTSVDRAKNRRVEIVILPQYTKKSIRELEQRRVADDEDIIK